MMFNNTLARQLLCCGLLIAACPSVFAVQGELWETSSTMKSAKYGTMPLAKNQDCQPANWQGQPRMISKYKQACSETTEQLDHNLFRWTQRCPVSQARAELRRISPDELVIEASFNGPDGEYELMARSLKIGSCELEEHNDDEQDAALYQDQ